MNREPYNENPMPAGNGLELLSVSGNGLVIIDQFMLGNDQFLKQLREDSPQGTSDAAGMRHAVEVYGGCVLPVDPGDFAVGRDPHLSAMIVGRASMQGEGDQRVADELHSELEGAIDRKGQLEPVARVFVDTRCLVFIDADLLFDQSLIGEYRHLRKTGQEKHARDFLRSRGAAVRYGFNRQGDELGVFQAGPELFALWPDAVE